MIYQHIILIWLGIAQALAAKDAPADNVLHAQKRDDIIGKLGMSICKNSANMNVTAGWDVGIFDAQLGGQWLSSIAKSKVADAQLEEMSKKLANENEHFGYASGKCPDRQHAWLITTPSPQAITIKPGDNLVVPIASLQLHCRQFRLDFAAATSGHPKTLYENSAADKSPELLMSLANLTDGTVEISCTPKNPPHRGPMVWYLVPVKKGPQPKVPLVEMLAEKKTDLPHALGEWINGLRTKEKLQPLTINNTKLEKSIREQATRVDLRHDREELENYRKKFQEVKRELIGEDRVFGRTLEEMAFLLWNSPTHRGLLLDTRAKDLIINVEGNPNEQYFAWILALK